MVASDLSELRASLARAVTRICPSWLVDSRDDLVQAAVMRVMRIQEKSEGERELSTSYLYRVAHSALVDEIRRVRRRREVSLEGGMDGEEDRVYPIATVEASGMNPEKRAAGRELGEAIRACLEKMKQERRMAVVLHLQGHTVPEAASLLSWTVKRAENLVYRGLANLRECLASKGFTPDSFEDEKP